MIEPLIDAAERRRFYRVDDRVALNFRVISDQELAEAVHRQRSGYPDRLSIASGFASTSAQMKHTVERVRRDLPDVAAYLEGLNEKLDLLVQLLAATENDLSERPTQEVSLSGSGISFRSAKPIEGGSRVEIKLLIFPSYTCVLAFGTVVRCVRDDEGETTMRYVVAVDFTHIRDGDRELIVRHVTQKQSAVLRDARVALDEI